MGISTTSQAEDAQPDMEAPGGPPRTRRQLLATAISAAGGALAARALAVAEPVEAANGSTVKVGQSFSGTATTKITNTAASSTAVAIRGVVSTTGAGGSTAGVYGDSKASGGRGVFGIGANGVVGNARPDTGVGVYGTATGSGYGVRGNGGYNGVYGSGGSYGVIGSGGPYGVFGSGDNTAVYGSGGTYGVQAYGSSYGVYGYSSSIGVFGQGGTYGVYGQGLYGVVGSSASNAGVYGYTSHPNMAAVYGTGGMYGVQGANGRTAGVRGDSGYVGVWGEGNDWGFFSIATGTNIQNYGIMAESKSATGYAGYFKGPVVVTGWLYKPGGSFRIDHPLDPDRRWLSHSFVESPDMMNIYNGTAVLDANGRATVRLPRYFNALNRDFRYQLTPIGSAAPSLHIARKVHGNSFRIAGGSAGQEVSWQITGIRQDDYANAHRLKVETRKRKADQGTRLFVAKGSGAKRMQVGPDRPKRGQPKLPKVKAAPKPQNPRTVRPRAPGD